MGCQTSYSCPITIPTAAGSTGAAGANGNDGAAVRVNSVATAVTSTSTGDQSLVLGSLTAGVMAAGDVLDFEAYITFTSAFVGVLQLLLGTQVLLTHTIAATDTVAPPTGETESNIILRSKVLFKTTSTQSYVSEVEFIEDMASTFKRSIQNCAQDSAGALALNVRCNPSAGATTCKYFTVTQSKKV